MTSSEQPDPRSSVQDVALIVGGGPGIGSSCARLFAQSGMRAAIAARNPDKAVLLDLEKTHGVRRYARDSTEPAAVESLFQHVVRDLGSTTLVVHNIDGRVAGIFRKGITEADPGMACVRDADLKVRSRCIAATQPGTARGSCGSKPGDPL